MRILWHANGVRVRTGYGKQTALVCRRLKQAGHEVFVSASYGVQGGPVELDGIVHLPGTLCAADHGQIALPLSVQNLAPDVVVTLLDVWPLPEDLGRTIAALGSRWVPWVPVDHQPVPPRVLVRLVHAHRVVAMSPFGQDQLHRAGIEADLIPHAVDPYVFCPGSQAEARAAVGLPTEGFGVVMVQANKGYPSRKCFQQQLEGFAHFHGEHPESWLYLHAWGGSEFGGPDLTRLVTSLGIREAVIGMDPYLGVVGMPEALMAQVYRAADVTLNATGGEGFGVPIIESLACGTPVIVTDFSAMSELCPAGTGWRVGITDRFYTGLDAFQVWPDPAQIAAALLEAFEADREAMVEPCVARAREFEAAAVAARWEALLSEAAGAPDERIDPKATGGGRSAPPPGRGEGGRTGER